MCPVGDVAYAVDGWDECVRACAEHHAVAFVGLSVALDGVCACYVCPAGDCLDAGCGEPCLDAEHEFADHLAFAGHYLGGVECGIAGIDPILLCIDGIGIGLCRVKEGLCRYAALIEAHSAKVVLFEDDGLQSGFAGTFGGGISCRSASDDS